LPQISQISADVFHWASADIGGICSEMLFSPLLVGQDGSTRTPRKQSHASGGHSTCQVFAA
jgi:hypothetical protein